MYDHLVQVVDLVETCRDLSGGSRDIYLNTVSQSTNGVMKTLASSRLFHPPDVRRGGLRDELRRHPVRDAGTLLDVRVSRGDDRNGGSRRHDAGSLPPSGLALNGRGADPCRSVRTADVVTPSSIRLFVSAGRRPDTSVEDALREIDDGVAEEFDL